MRHKLMTAVTIQARVQRLAELDGCAKSRQKGGRKEEKNYANATEGAGRLALTITLVEKKREREREGGKKESAFFTSGSLESGWPKFCTSMATGYLNRIFRRLAPTSAAPAPVETSFEINQFARVSTGHWSEAAGSRLVDSADARRAQFCT